MLDVAICIVDDNIVFQQDSAGAPYVQRSPKLELLGHNVFATQINLALFGRISGFLGLWSNGVTSHAGEDN